jgi:hypothetical protein
MLKRWRGLILGVGLCLGVAASVFVPQAVASRNSSGTYSLPSGQPVVAGTTISPSVHNTFASDIATELTSSLDRSGRGAMLAPLQCSNGTVAAPSLTFGSDPDTGLYRIGANNPGLAAGGTKIQEWATTTSTLTVPLLGAVGAVGAPGYAFEGDTNTGIYRIGANNPAIAADGAKVQDWISTGTTITGTATVTGNATLQGTAAITGLATLTAGSTSPGNHILTGAEPASTTGFTNTLTSGNLIKAWAAIVTNGAGGATVSQGFNVAGAAISGTNVVVTIANDLAAVVPGVMAFPINAGGDYIYFSSAASGSSVTIAATKLSDGNPLNHSTVATNFTVLILGDQ